MAMPTRPKTAEEALEQFQGGGGFEGGYDKGGGSKAQYWDPMDQAMRGFDQSVQSPERALSILKQRYGGADPAAPPAAGGGAPAPPPMPGGGGSGIISAAMPQEAGAGWATVGPGALNPSLGKDIQNRASMNALASMGRNPY